MGEYMQYVELTQAQKRIWVTQKLYPQSSMYHIGGLFTVDGNLDLIKMSKSIGEVFENVQLPYIRLREEEHICKQYLKKTPPIILYEDFTNTSGYKSILTSDFQRKMDLEDSPLYKIIVFRFKKGVGFYFKLHHIIVDGFSIQLLIKMIVNHYEDSNLKLEEHFYADIIENEKKYFNSTQFESDKKYWSKIMKDLRFNNDIAPIKGTNATRLKHYIPEKLRIEIKEFCSKCNVSPYSIVILSYILFESRMSEDTVFTICCPLLARSGVKERKQVGMLVNNLLIPFSIERDMSIWENLKNINRSLKETYRYLKYPYNYLMKEFAQNNHSHDYYKASINFYTGKYPEEIDGKKISIEELFSGEMHYGLQIVMNQLSKPHELYFDYNHECYSEAQISNLSNVMIENIRTIVNNPQLLISEPNQPEPVVNTKENTKCETESFILEKDLFFRRFLQQVVSNPEKIALISDNENITYTGLYSMSKALAEELVEYGVNRGDIVACYFSKKLETVIGILAIMQVKATVLPLDDEWPLERMNYILDQTQPKAILSNIDDPSFRNKERKWFKYNANFEYYMKFLINQDDYITVGNDSAYLIYTSGSTGNPKGVMVSHANLANYLLFASQTYQTKEEIVMPLFTSIAFDLTLTSMFLPLYSGGTIRVYEGKDEHVLGQIMKDHSCTLIKLTPSHLAILAGYQAKGTHIQKIIVGGEDLKANLSSKIYKLFDRKVEIYNEYGPTEATIGCMTYQYSYHQDVDGSVPIGRAIDNVEIILLDKFKRPVEKGSIGEIHISGECISKGYHKEPDLTQERFIERLNGDDKVWYETGDLARYNDNNHLVFMGRVDSQIKLNGYRVELAEIEVICSRYKGIDMCAAILDTRSEQPYIVLYFTASNPIDIKLMSQYLQKYLPFYMVPSIIINILEFKLTQNKKVDRNALLSYNLTIKKSETKDKLEILMEHVGTVLQREELERGTNYFSAGGDSIKALQLSSALLSSGYRLKIADILSNPILENMAKHIVDASDYKDSIDVLNSDSDTYSSPAIFSWFYQQHFKNPNSYIHSILLKLKQRITWYTVASIQNELLNNHSSLKIKMISELEWTYVEGSNGIMVEEQTCSESELEVNLELLYYHNIQYLDINLGSNMKLALLHTEEFDYIFMNVHHIAIDGYSWNIMLRDIDNLLEKEKSKKGEWSISQEHAKFHEYTLTMNKKYGEVESLDTFDINYFNNIDVFEKKSTTQKGQTQNMRQIIAHNDSKAINNMIYRNDMKEDIFFIAVLLKALKDRFNYKSTILEIEFNNRTRISKGDLFSRTTGWFTSIIPLKFEMASNTLEELYIEAKQQMRNIDKKILALPGLNKRSQENRDKVTLRLNVIKWFEDFDNFIVSTNTSQELEATDVVDIDIYIQEQFISIHYRYDDVLFYDDEVEELKEAVGKVLKDIISYEDTGTMYVASKLNDSGLSLMDIKALIDL